MFNYKYYTNGSKVVAVSTYAGKVVRGVAKCNPADAFDLEKGKQLAAARCAVKVAEKRCARAGAKYNEAYGAWVKAEDHLDAMSEYWGDAEDALRDAEYELKELLGNL